MIVVPEDELRYLERHYGPDVRHMGTWNSDGVFGFCAVPVAVFEKAVQAVAYPMLPEAMDALKAVNNRTQKFMEIIRAVGPRLVKEIAAVSREDLGRSRCAPDSYPAKFNKKNDR